MNIYYLVDALWWINVDEIHKMHFVNWIRDEVDGSRQYNFNAFQWSRCIICRMHRAHLCFCCRHDIRYTLWFMCFLRLFFSFVINNNSHMVNMTSIIPASIFQNTHSIRNGIIAINMQIIQLTWQYLLHHSVCLQRESYSYVSK